MSAYNLTHHYVDVAVIGAGGAGLRAACAAAAGGLTVACISKVTPTRSHTVAAQGGINAALGNRMADEWQWHMYDTVRGSDWLGDQDAIALMCERAPAAIVELEHMGMAFSRDGGGRIYQRAYGGQYADFGKGGPAYRACAVADRTGHALLHTLYAEAMKLGVRFFVEYLALDLLMENGECRGVLVWHIESGQLHVFHAHRTILATGGFGQAWAATTSSSICTGDGGAMVSRAGLPLQDMEFVQFHPTSLYGSGILITEGARGEGAVLRNAHGERFMERYAPKSMELASRDVISRAMMSEIMAGRGCGPNKDHLHLCLDHLSAEMVEAQLPSIIEIARAFARIDARRDPIPVVPAVHYTMGGIPADAASGVIAADGTSQVPNLMVIGEAACNSVHGANRLGCNSLLDLVVFGRAAGEACAQQLAPGSYHPDMTPAALDAPLALLDRLRHASGEVRPKAIRVELQKVMHRYASIFRNRTLLAAGQEQAQKLWQQFQTCLRVSDRGMVWNTELAEAYETESLLRHGLSTLASASAREESRGAHWREDFPARDDANWQKHTLARMTESGHVEISARPVRGHGSLPHFAPEPRTY